jgi:hypothetical protein
MALMVTNIAVPVGASRGDAAVSAVSWAAIFGGAFAAAAIALILMELGAGLGLETVAPWRHTGPSATTFSIIAGIWLIVVQWIGAGVGGYIAGRLRTKWVGVHTDEVFFRDTAHGLLSWALATVIGAGFVAYAAFATVSGTVGAAATVACGAAQLERSAANPAGYFADLLFRSSTPPAAGAATGPDPRPEVARILTKDATSDGLTPDDRTYVAQLVAARTGLSQPDAEKRVDGVVVQLKAAQAKAAATADAVRKASASAAIIMALALLIGAFIASAAGALGGRRRDSF